MNEEQIKQFLQANGWNTNVQPSKTQIWIAEHPVATLGIITGGAALVGGVIGFLVGRATA